MSVQSVGPFSNFKTNFNTTKQAASNPQIVQDVAKDVSKNNKKTAAIIGGVAALAILGTGALVAIKRHKVPNEIKTALSNFEKTNEAANALAQSVQKQADEVTEYAQRLFNNVSDLFKKGDEITPDGTVLRKIRSLDDTCKVMEEFSDDGKLVRKSMFTDGILGTVREGIEELADGSEKVAKNIIFEDGKLSLYQEGLEELADESGKVAKNIIFKDGKPCLYQEGCETFADLLSGKVAKAIGFENGKPRLYLEGIEGLADGSVKVAKEFELTDKGWREVSK